MPFTEIKYSNYWFSSSDGQNVEIFSDLISKTNVEKLKKENGLCIVYTYIASVFVDAIGKMNPRFKNNIEYLSEQNGWFVPSSQILDYLISQKKEKYPSQLYINVLDFKWFIDRIFKKVKYGK